MLGAKRICRVRIAKDELEKISKEDFHKSWLLQEQYVDYIEAKLNENTDQLELASLRESEEKLRQQQLDATRKENILVMRLTTKEQEMQEYAGQIQELKQAHIPTAAQLRSALLDPAVNLMFEKMQKEIETLKTRLEETQDELSAWKFTPDSNTGKRLMAKCRLLHQENEELGKNISSGRFAKLEGDLALQKNFSEEMKKSQSELDEFVMELDEDVEGMQSTIYYLQQQLRDSKDQFLKLQKENEKLSNLSLKPSVISNCTVQEPIELSNNNNKLEVQHNSLTPNAVSLKSPVPSPSSTNSNRTESLPSPIDSNEKETNSGQAWSPPSLKSLENSQLENCTDVSESQKPPSPLPSKSKLSEAEIVTVSSVRGSLHMEEYDSEQDPEQSVTSEDDASDSFLVKMPNASQKKMAVESGSNRRTSENGGRGRKRTRSSCRTQVPVQVDNSSELPAVKRLRHRSIIVDKEIVNKVEQKRTSLEIDTDTEVQVAHTLARWAVANKGRNDRERITESLGNGELKVVNKNCEKAN